MSETSMLVIRHFAEQMRYQQIANPALVATCRASSIKLTLHGEWK
ncbi:hypothetical protein PS634_03883 [Pseudomonas fluorescens]|nr:hypothetical protein PS634_03883 [Pseudomonas fluorescens]